MLRSTSRVQNNVEQARTVIRHISQNNSELSFLKYDFGNEVQPISRIQNKVNSIHDKKKVQKSSFFCEKTVFLIRNSTFFVNHTVLTPKSLERMKLKW